MILTVGNTKGGVGKTTIALNIAAAAAISGKSVFFIDGDSQGTALTAITIRNEAGVQPAIGCAAYPAAAQIKTQLSLIRDKYDLIVIDVGGRETAALRASLLLSDVLVIPFAPRSFDVWALSDIHSIIEEANAMRPVTLRCFGVLNGADSRGNDNQEAIEALADYPLIQHLPTPLAKRKSVANAASRGLCIFEHRPRDEKAEVELNALISMLFGS